VFERFYREVEQIYPTVPAKLKFNETVKRVLNRFVDDLIRNTQARTSQARIQSLDGIRNHSERLAAFSPAVEAERKQSKDFLYENLYFSSALAGEKDDAERVVGELFAFWMDHPQALPHNYQEKAKAESLPRTICDYIAGMTDNFIFEQYEKHCGAR
jgi:dGTPase